MHNRALVQSTSRVVDVMSTEAAQAYEAIDPGIKCRVIGPYPFFSQKIPDDDRTPPLTGGCGSTGEPPKFTII